MTSAESFSAGGYRHVAVTVAAFGLLCVITYVLFRFGGRFVTYLGASALGVVTRMMGLILAVIGTQTVIQGEQGAFALAS